MKHAGNVDACWPRATHGLSRSIANIAAQREEARRPQLLQLIQTQMRLLQRPAMAAGSAEAGQPAPTVVTQRPQLLTQGTGRRSEMNLPGQDRAEVTAGAVNHCRLIGMIRLPTFTVMRGKWITFLKVTRQWIHLVSGWAAAATATTAAAAAAIPTTKPMLGVKAMANQG